ncbi:DUF1631 family protein [Agaribacterium sp. ZY112]|uniref:DUF1631 family protein n=1 Tax=Agaribacterium sp. ZY112 TaxID=3233574 RepID=UPI003523B99C
MISNANKELLQQIAEISHDHIQTLLAELFSSSDQLFYELSGRATTNNEENLYFEAKRAIRSARNKFISDFGQKLETYFKSLVEEQSQAYLNPAATPEADNALSIVDSEVLELELAQKNMADRSRDTYRIELHELEARLAKLLEPLLLKQQHNPLAPLTLSQLFSQICKEQLSLNIKTQLIMFKLFETHVLKQLGHVFADCNRVLINAGILPKVAPPKSKTVCEEAESRSGFEIEQKEALGAETAASETRSTGAFCSRGKIKAANFEQFETGTQAVPSNNTFQPLSSQLKHGQNLTQNLGHHQGFNIEASVLSVLMASIRTARQTQLPDIDDLANYHVFSENPGTLMPAAELSQKLSQAQTQLDARIDQGEPKNYVPLLVKQILAKQDPKKPQATSQPDEDIINLIALFFDKILEDEQLPIAVQSLICRLQIPVLKVALYDSNFLNDQNHPARLLINTITEAGMGIDDNKSLEKDTLYQLMSRIIQQLNRQFKLDQDFFRTARAEIQAALQSEQDKAAIVTSRTEQSESGKVKLSCAREMAQTTIYEKIKDQQLPAQLNEFLVSTWLQVLLISHARGGRQSSEWIEYEQVVSDLVWISQGHSDTKSIARLQRLLPNLLQQLATGIALTINNDEVCKEKLAELEHLLIKAANNTSPQIQRQGINSEQRIKLGKDEHATKAWEDMDALERQQSRYEQLSNEFYQKAKDMAEGTWFNYLGEKKALRCKLSAKLNAENYIFVNRFGFKALNKSRRQFAYDMQFKKAIVLSNTPLFDRIMTSLITRVGNISKASQPLS